MINSGSVSYKFQDLEKRLNDIRIHFNIDTLKGDSGEFLSWDLLDELQKDCVRAYVALCHAEIESHFEYWATNIINRALNIWKEKNKITLPLLSLCIHFKFIDSNSDTNEKIHQVVSLFKSSVIRENNGIKGANILKLFKPLGVDEASIMSISPALDSFGVKRGEAVHTSIKVQQPLDIPTLISEVHYIQHSIKEFEELLDTLI